MTTRRLTPADVLELALPGDCQLSPDGRRLVYALKQINKEKNEYKTRLMLMDLDGDHTPRPFTSGTADHSPRWSPDGNWLAFVRKVDDTSQLFVIPAYGGEARQVTDVKGGVEGGLAWAPDCTRIAFTVQIGPDGIRRAEKEDENDLFKKYTKSVRRYDRAAYKFDGMGLFDPQVYDQICVVDFDENAAGPALPKQITRGEFFHSSPAWSPDGARLAFAANRRSDWDYTPHISDIWTVDVDGESEPVQLTDGLNLGSPVWSPDGARIATLGHDHFGQRHWYSNTALWLVDVPQKTVRRLAAEWDRPWGAQTVGDSTGPVAGL